MPQSIKGRLIGGVITLAILFCGFIALDHQIDLVVAKNANWRLCLARGRALFLEVVKLYHDAADETDPQKLARISVQIEKRSTEVHAHFDRLLKGDAATNLPPAPDPAILDAIEATDRYWHEKVEGNLKTASQKHATPDQLQSVEDSLAVFDVVVELGESITDEVLANNLKSLRLAEAILALLAAGFAVLVIRSTKKTAEEIETVAEIAADIRNGNWARRSPAGSSRELSVLSGAFNEMTEKLVQQRNHFKTLIDTMGEIFIVVAPDRTITSVNNACLAMTQFREDELVGKEIGTLLAEVDRLDWLLDGSRENWNASLVVLRAKDGSTIQTAISATSLRGPDGRFIGSSMLCRDMTAYNMLLHAIEKSAAAEAVAETERRKAAELSDLNNKLRETQLQVVEASKFAALGEMAGNIAHEINNPLAIIAAIATLYKDLLAGGSELPKEKLVDAFTKLEKTTARIARIIKGMRMISRDASRDPFQLVTLEQVVEDTLDLCREKFQSLGIDLRTDPVPGEITLECLPVQVSQVILNLLNNARDAIESATVRWVHLGIKAQDSAVEISVTDSGPGIAADVRKKLMQPFFTTKAPGKGTGLGLSISRSLVQNHGGSLVLNESCPNTQFLIRLPYKQPARPVSQKAA